MIQVHIQSMHSVRFNAANPTWFRIDRRTVLGNPFPIGVHWNRETSIAQYRRWLVAVLSRPEETPQKRALRRILDAAEKHGEVTLFCWCAPLPCHGEVLRDLLLKSHAMREARRSAQSQEVSNG